MMITPEAFLFIYVGGVIGGFMAGWLIGRRSAGRA